MKCFHTIISVRDAINLTLQTIQIILSFEFKNHFVNVGYNDFRSEEGTIKLHKKSKKLRFGLMRFSDIAKCLFPNNLLLLQMTQRYAIDFHQSGIDKNRYDITIANLFLKSGFENYLFTELSVRYHSHPIHIGRQLRDKNSIKYCWFNFRKGLEKFSSLLDSSIENNFY